MHIKTIPFGLNFRGDWSPYSYSEFSNFIECADNIGGENDLEGRYITFLGDFLDKKIKPSTQVDLDVMETFHGDIDNRADIDYREGHWDDTPEIVAGGKYFATIAEKLAGHIAKHI
tara:strand:- start:1404 stop:1751 length:348 start_codon:yes stop_codon:yes gene_type:complete